MSGVVFFFFFANKLSTENTPITRKRGDFFIKLVLIFIIFIFLHRILPIDAKRGVSLSHFSVKEIYQHTRANRIGPSRIVLCRTLDCE